MSDLPAREAPVWVRKRDGRVVPFEADRISRALFAATESLGQPDAFLARELTDTIVHFLTDQNGEDIPSTEQIGEVVVTNVRELGHPLLARLFEDHCQARVRSDPVVAEAAPTAAPRPERPPTNIEIALRFPAETPVEEVLRACTRSYTLQAVFARDVVAIHNDGLLTLLGLDTPGALASCVLDARAFGPDGDLTTAQVELRGLCGQVLVLDGPEHHQARTEKPAAEGARLAKQLQRGLERTGLQAVLNLNCATPPSSVDDLARGPLFPGLVPVPSRRLLADLADQWLDQVAGNPGMAHSVRIDWHLAERDFRPEKEGARERLLRVANRALAGARLAFAFDRPRRPIALAEGINRQQPAVLQQVGLHLPRLAEQTNSTADPERFLQKLSSLARLALSAGVQKRKHLRRRQGEATASDITEGFLLDRARLLVIPIGLDRVVRTLTGRGLCAGGAALDLGKQVIQRLLEVLRLDGRASRLEACLDGPVGDLPATEEAGLTPWEPGAAVKAQWRSGGAVHALAEHGTLILFVPAGEVTAEQVVQWLQQIAEQTEVVRVLLRRE